jgi:hypothetical protein
MIMQVTPLLPILKRAPTVKLKTFFDAPTPWMTVNTPYAVDAQYRFRIFLRRRGGALHVEMHKTSPLHPAQTHMVRASKPGFFDFVKAAHGLLRVATWDKTCQPGVRAVWNPAATEYKLRMAYATTVAAFLPRILTPTMGRPRQGVLAGGALAPAPRTAYATARRLRREELLLLTQAMTNLLTPAIETFTAHRMPQGYNRAETRRIQLQRINQHFRGEVFNDGLSTTAETMRAYHEEHPQEREREPDGTFTPAPPAEADVTSTWDEDEMARVQREFDELMKEIAP